MHQIDRIILIDEDLCQNESFIASLTENFNVPVELQVDPELYDANTQNAVYVSCRFEGPFFEKLAIDKKPVISDLIVKNCIETKTNLPVSKYPLFNWYMKDFVICFSINDKNDKKKAGIINKYLNLIRFMGGQSRRDMKSGKSFERTHLITEDSTYSYNYRLAVIYEIPILYKEWIDFLWDHRRTLDFIPSDPVHFISFKVKPFVNLKISLLNFPPEEYEKLAQAIRENDGEVVQVNDENSTHLVVYDPKESNYWEILEESNHIPNFVVTEKWLLVSLSTQNRDEEDTHKLNVPLREITDLPNTPSKDDSLVNQTQNSTLFSPPRFDVSIDESIIIDKNELKKKAITHELYETEANYVLILNNILKVFRDPLKSHEMPGQFPNEIELKTIFGNLPPIIAVHENILIELEPIYQAIVNNLKAENQVGKVFQKHSQEFLTVYPQYVNYYENTKDMIVQCIEKYPKFAAFLKACQTLPECKKQTFQELLINPIQRLPRIELYLRTLLERTDKAHPEHKLLNEALNTIVHVNSKINNEKKKTEGQIEMFDLLNDIEDVPPTLLSANRHFISKCDVRLILNEAAGEFTTLSNYHFSLLLFTDLLLLCKKRTLKRTNSLRDRSTPIPSSLMKKAKKTYKYIETIEFAFVKTIYPEFEIIESFPDSSNAFAFTTHPVNILGGFLTYPFVVKDPEMKKNKFTEDFIQAVKAFFKLVSDDDETKEFTVTDGYFNSLSFNHSKTIARNLHRSKSIVFRTRDRFNRTFLKPRSPSMLHSSMSMENLNTSNNLLSSPAKKRISRVFTNFLAPRENIKTLPRNSRMLGSINDLSSVEEVNGQLSLPSTPAPCKKKYQEESDLETP